MNDEQQYINFDEYVKASEPHKRERAEAWRVAIGLQAVDGLQTSEYLQETARRNIEGEITIDEARELVKQYYIAKVARDEDDADKEEADKVSGNISKLLQTDAFSFSAAGLASIHRSIFQGVFKHAGRFRDYDISKKEWVLQGDSVIYGRWQDLSETIAYDIEQERQFDYTSLSKEQMVEHLAKFTSGLWQIHPFCEGNTRTTAIFIIKYLRSLGFSVNNELFERHSWYFRNALVRANYSNIPKKIYPTIEWLERFFRNMLLGEENELKNRYLHIRYQSQSAKEDSPKCKICTLDCTLEESAVYEYIKQNPRATQKEIALHIHKSERTVKSITVNLVGKGLIERKNGKRNGYWEIR